MWMLVLRGAIAGVVVVAVSVLGKQHPRLGGFLLTLPVVSIIAFVAAWQQQKDLAAVSRLARETLVLVPLGLPFFVPLAFAGRLGLSFWPSFGVGVVSAAVTVGLWLWLGPQRL